VLDVRCAGIPVIVLIGGANGCFGGMGIVARCADHIVMSDVGRLAMSGPEVIEASHGVEEYDSRDRALVWRTSGGKHRWLIGDCDALVEDDVQAFRAAAIAAMKVSSPVTLEALEAEHALLDARLRMLPSETGGADAATWLWRELGIDEPERVPELDIDAVRALRAA
jgi:malonate decarboxylase beta subunit